jgi:hypothetical protein
MLGKKLTPEAELLQEYEDAKYGKYSLLDMVIEGNNYTPIPPKSAEEIEAIGQRLRAAIPGQPQTPAELPEPKLVFKKRTRPERRPLKACLGECVEWLKLHYGPAEGVKRAMELTGRSENPIHEWCREVSEDQKATLRGRYQSFNSQEMYDDWYGEQPLLENFAHWDDKSLEQVIASLEERGVDHPLPTSGRRPHSKP